MRETGKGVTERDFARKPLVAAEIEAIVDAAGGVAAVLSTRGAPARARGWTAEQPPGRAEFVAAAAADNNLLRRPILVVAGPAGSRFAVGNDPAGIRAALGSE